MFDSYSKKYFCNCNPDKAGVNCTFKNKTELEYIKNLTLKIAQIYNPMSLSGRRTYDQSFLKFVTAQPDLMSEDVVDTIYDILSYQVGKLKTNQNNIGQNDDAEGSLQILSNMIEFQQMELLKINKTQAWKTLSDPEAKRVKMNDNLKKTMSIFNQIRESTRGRLSFLQTEIAMQSRMLSYR